MNQLLNIYKPTGVTPLQLVQQLRREKPEYEKVKIGYAGRLDPMAHGVMLLMVGEETKNREKYLSLPKSYEFTVMFGVETDTYDILGLLKDTKSNQTPSNANLIVNSFVSSKIGTQIQKYPSYSSKTVQGKPLFWWAKNNRLAEIEIPEHEISIDSFSIISFKKIQRETLHQQITKNISSLKGDFRQKEILKSWKDFFQTNPDPTFPLATFTITCSSGTYVRGLADELGKELGCGAITLDILRTQLGEFECNKSVRFLS
jgi:tRNA pseudouridine55 synthase